MAGMAITRMDLGTSELRAEARFAKTPAVVRRILALALVPEVMDRETAPKSCGMDCQSLRVWVYRYNDGMAGPANRKSNDTPNMTDPMPPLPGLSPV